MKRFFDLAFSILALLVLFPLFLLISVILKFSGEGEIFYSQARVGKEKRPFKILKFATMLKKSPNMGSGTITLKNDPRILPFGKFLRKTKINELPQLINILKGEMSLIGPRPLLIQYLPRYSPEQSKRHNVKPGITGWAQVNGRNAISWEQKFKLDIEYVEKQSFALDLKILWMTFLNVLQRKDVSADGHVSMEEFKG